MVAFVTSGKMRNLREFAAAIDYSDWVSNKKFPEAKAKFLNYEIAYFLATTTTDETCQINVYSAHSWAPTWYKS
jgi:hypothetical protein